MSLIDDEFQFVAAEMTSVGSISDNSRHPPGVTPCVGATALDLFAGVCAATMPAFTQDDDRYRIANDNVIANDTRYVINDLTKVPMFSDRPYVSQYPGMRWYAEVPIRTASGFVLGTYSVVDNKTRPGLSEDEFLTLVDIASAIMKHLEALKIRSDYERASGLLEGLDTFVQVANDSGKETPDTTAMITPVAERRGSELGFRGTQQETTSVTNPEPKKVHDPENTTSQDRRDDGQTSPLALHESIEATFSRAASLLREAMDLEGVMLLDASFSGFASRSEPDWLDARVIDLQNTAGNPLALNESSELRIAEELRHGQLPMAECLGVSLRKGSANDGTSLPQQMNQSLIRHFPNGALFNLSREFALSGFDLQSVRDSDSVPDGKDWREHGSQVHLRRIILEETLRSCLPGAHSVVFFPLQNPHKSKLTGGVVGWSKQPKRVFQSEDLSYFSVFGSAVMMEVTRLEQAANDRAMSDFVSSMSHELRSPLHGILGSAELLEQTIATSEQKHLVGMIENCGRTLLHTMDQV